MRVGDGVGATAYSVVNTTNFTIDSIIVTDPGRNYTYANTFLEANSLYGNGGVISALLSPIDGAGANVQNELNSRNTGISIQFQNSSIEGQYFSTNGSFRQIGLMKNPKFRDVTLTINTFCRSTGNIVTSSTNNFTAGEYVFQPATQTAAAVVFANSTFIEVQKISGSGFTTNNANDFIFGTSSQAFGNLVTLSTKEFPVNTSITQTVYQDHTEANGILVAANSTLMLLTNTIGIFTNSSVVSDYNKYRGSWGAVYDPSSNSFATVDNIGVARKNTNFTFDKFNQIHRVVVDSITGTFIPNERVAQGTSHGFIYNTNNDIDLILSGLSGSFSIGDTITQTTTGATATVVSANSTYLRLTSATGTFLPGFEVVATGSGANAISDTVYNILYLYGTDSDFAQSSLPTIGEQSNAQATTVSNRSLAHDLVRNTGEVLYIQNSTAVIKSATSQEQIKIVVQYL